MAGLHVTFIPTRTGIYQYCFCAGDLSTYSLLCTGTVYFMDMEWRIGWILLVEPWSEIMIETQNSILVVKFVRLMDK